MLPVTISVNEESNNHRNGRTIAYGVSLTAPSSWIKARAFYKESAASVIKCTIRNLFLAVHRLFVSFLGMNLLISLRTFKFAFQLFDPGLKLTSPSR